MLAGYFRDKGISDRARVLPRGGARMRFYLYGATDGGYVSVEADGIQFRSVGVASIYADKDGMNVKIGKPYAVVVRRSSRDKMVRLFTQIDFTTTPQHPTRDDIVWINGKEIK